MPEKKVTLPRLPHDETGLPSAVLGDLYEIVQIDPTEDHPAPEWRAELRDKTGAVIAYTRFTDDPAGGGLWRVFWNDTRGRAYLWNTSLHPNTTVGYLKRAANRALREGGFAAAIAKRIVMEVPDSEFLRSHRKDMGEWYQWDVIPIGAATNMVQVSALAKMFFRKPTVVKAWLKRMNVPIIRMPNGRNYFSLIVLEMALLIEMGVAKTWSEAITILKDCQTVTKAASKAKTLDRLRALCHSMTPDSAQLNRLLERRRVRKVE